MQNNLWELMCRIGQRHGDVTAFLYRKGKHITAVPYQEFMEDVLRCAYQCNQISEDRIGIWGYNSYRWVVTAFAMLLSGKTLILLDANLNDEDFLTLTSYTEVEVLTVSEDLKEEAKRLLPEMPVYAFGALEGGEILTEEQIREKEFICFTSGTSRSSKGVVISTEALAGTIELARETLPGKAGERFYLPLPFHHIYGFTEILHILMMGGIVCLGEIRYVEQDMKEFQPQTALLVPTMLQYLLEKGKLPDSLYAVVTGGGACREEYAEAVKATGRIYRNLYGLSETLGAVCSSTDRKRECWMKPFEGNRFIRNEEGEIGLYLPWHMKEYYKKPEDTAGALEENILWTGDAGDVDEEGFARIRGRVRDTIVLENGEKIHAEDVDREWMNIEGIEDAAVFLSEGELTLAVRTSEEFPEGQAKKLLEEFNRERAVSHRIRKIWISPDPFPRTTTGKLKRFALEAVYCEWRKSHA